MISAGETVVLVGASGEMGRAFCRELLTRGYRVVAVARSLSNLAAEEQASGKLVLCPADISQDSAEASIKACLEGPVRAVIHSAGVPSAGGIANASTEALNMAFNIKVGGFIRLVRAVDEHLVENSRLIAIGGHYGFEPTAYAAGPGVANAALVNLVRQYSWLYGQRGITAHMIAPGPADTPRLRAVAQARADHDELTLEQVLHDIASESTLNELTRVEDIVWAGMMILSPQARAMAGSTLFMDSGRRHGLP
ncbi:MAG: SDR family oxidoreductase [Halieaceae bacterium]|nr:SDR family oxidoreductase [Halieaceae bacterium]